MNQEEFAWEKIKAEVLGRRQYELVSAHEDRGITFLKYKRVNPYLYNPDYDLIIVE